MWYYSLIPDSSFVGTEQTKLFWLCTNKAFPALYQKSSLDIGYQCLSVRFQHSSISTLIKREFALFERVPLQVPRIEPRLPRRKSDVFTTILSLPGG